MYPRPTMQFPLQINERAMPWKTSKLGTTNSLCTKTNLPVNISGKVQGPFLHGIKGLLDTGLF